LLERTFVELKIQKRRVKILLCSCAFFSKLKN
jgi:hypothetical protein